MLDGYLFYIRNQIAALLFNIIWTVIYLHIFKIKQVAARPQKTNINPQNLQNPRLHPASAGSNIQSGRKATKNQY